MFEKKKTPKDTVSTYVKLYRRKGLASLTNCKGKKKREGKYID